MNNIRLQDCLPNVFAAESAQIQSGIWRNDISFNRGEYSLVEAFSGSGKSSLCSYVYGWRKDYQGIISFDEKNINTYNNKDWTEIKRTQLSMMFQGLRLFPELTARENVYLNNRLTKYKSTKEIKILFERMGIADKIDEKSMYLSFGQQQRVALIRALCQPYSFLILDEPTSHLDAANTSIIGKIVLEEVKRQGAGLIVTSLGMSMDVDYQNIYKL